MNRSALERAFKSLGLDRGGTVFVHSSLSSIGRVEGGADAVVGALLDTVGQEGTLVAPAFTFGRERALFDPATDPSGMGLISETVRTHPRALRSVHMYHSVTAIGRAAEEFTSVLAPSAWAGDGAFWQLVELDASILLLGVTYRACTFFHVIEQLLQVPYRQWVEEEIRLRDRDGTELPLTSSNFWPKPDFPGNEFNKFGCALEERGLVVIQPVGNAMARLFKAREAMSLGVELYRQDRMIFAQTGTGRIPLEDGVEIENERSVVDPNAVFNRGGSGGD